MAIEDIFLVVCSYIILLPLTLLAKYIREMFHRENDKLKAYHDWEVQKRDGKCYKGDHCHKVLLVI